MNILFKYLEMEDIEEMKDTFDYNVFQKLKDNNVKKIILYLKNNHIDFIEDILIYYLDLFILDADEFISRFEKLKIKYPDISESLGNNMEILEMMYI